MRIALGDLRRTPARQVVAASLALALATGFFALTFGVLAVAAGASVPQTCVLSLLVFTGASQFSFVGVLGAGGSAASALGSALLLAARNGVYGLVMSRHLPGTVRRRLLTAHFLLDETTAMASAQSDPDLRRLAFWTTGLSLFTCWNLGTLLGALVGSALDPATWGLDAAFPAAFVAMLWPQLRAGRRPRQAAAAGALICAATVPLTPVGVPLLCAALAALIGIPSEVARS